MRMPFVAVAIVCSAASSVSQATGLFGDPFGYATGTALRTNSPPWNNSTPNQVNSLMTVVGAGPTYAGIPSGGNAVQMSNGSADTPTVTLNGGTPITTGRVYYSMVLQLNAAFAPTNNNQAYFAGFDDHATGTAFSSGAALVAKRDAGDASKIDLGIAAPGNNNLTKKYSATAYSTSDVLFVVGSYTFNGDTTTDDVQNLYVFMNGEAIPTTEPETPTATTSTNASDLTGVNRFYLRNNTGEAPTMLVDELRVGTRWEDILPKTGDANLDGKIDLDDLAVLDRGNDRYQTGAIAPGTAGWTDGDVNGDHVIDSADYQAMYALLAPPPAQTPVGLVPEPAVLTVVGMGMSVVVGRRRRGLV